MTVHAIDVLPTGQSGAHCSPLQGTESQKLKSTAPRWVLRCGQGSWWATELADSAIYRTFFVYKLENGRNPAIFEAGTTRHDQTSDASKSTKMARFCPDVHCCRFGRHTQTLEQKPEMWNSVFDTTAGALAFITHR